MQKVVVGDSLNNKLLPSFFSFVIADDNFDSVSQVGSSVGLFFCKFLTGLPRVRKKSGKKFFKARE